MGSRQSQMKQAAKRTGCTVEEWHQNRESGLNWCIDCRQWLNANLFAADRTRYSGLQQYCKGCAKIRGIACRYKISKEEAILLNSAIYCAICRRPNQKFEVDHDHQSGKVRDVLCSRCNGALGQFCDSIELLKEAIKYLESHNG